MCGIAGKLNLDGARPVDPDLLRRMTESMAHRGPDGMGIYNDGAVGLGHRRLSIIDLSKGAQPICNEDGTVWITFNGEIYNYRELRRDLVTRGHKLKSDSDTEVIVHLWEDYGPLCVDHLQGMFAFGIWDARQRCLFLARDRVGIKPLYYCSNGHSLVFSSELKALLADADVPRRVDHLALDAFLTFLYLPGAATLFADIRKLEPGHYLLVQNGQVVIRKYWELEFDHPHEAWNSIGDAVEALDDLLGSTVESHMISDVPVGFLASGGVDSTGLLSYATSTTKRVVPTFTVGFSGTTVTDERPYARLAAKQFATSHHEVTISARDFAALLPLYVWHMEEPVCEPPAIALYYVSRFARDYVKVLVSGEGGDEAFAGYPEYRNYAALESGKRLAGGARRLIPLFLRLARPMIRPQRVAKYSALANMRLEDYYYSRLTLPVDYLHAHKRDLYSPQFACGIEGCRAGDTVTHLFNRVRGQHPLNQMLYVDTKTWLPDDLLVKADKMTMAASIELRVPFLDHKVLEFAASLPPSFKIRGRQTKRVLRHVLRKRVPPPILSRKKAGFPVPFDAWLNGELREMAMDTVLSDRAISRGYFRREGLEAALRRRDPCGSRDMFALMVLELWHQQFVDRTYIAPAGTASSQPVTVPRRHDANTLTRETYR